MSDNSHNETIRNFIIESFASGERPENLPDDLDLIKSGVLDSLALVETASFLEDLAGTEIGSHQLTPDNVGSIGAMTAFIQRLRAEL